MPYKNKEDRQEQWRRWAIKNKDNYELKKKNRVRALARFKFKESMVCSIKGCSEIGERHHEDYNKPYEIIWLCRRHHNILRENPRICDVEGCNRPHKARGLCHKHWMQKYRKSRSKKLSPY